MACNRIHSAIPEQRERPCGLTKLLWLGDVSICKKKKRAFVGEGHFAERVFRVHVHAGVVQHQFRAHPRQQRLQRVPQRLIHPMQACSQKIDMRSPALARLGLIVTLDTQFRQRDVAQCTDVYLADTKLT